MRSLKIFLEENKVALGVKISAAPLSLHSYLLAVSLYMIEQLPRLLKEIGAS
jgi:hypothetical protein